MSAMNGSYLVPRVHSSSREAGSAPQGRTLAGLRPKPSPRPHHNYVDTCLFWLNRNSRRFKDVGSDTRAADQTLAHQTRAILDVAARLAEDRVHLTCSQRGEPKTGHQQQQQQQPETRRGRSRWHYIRCWRARGMWHDGCCWRTGNSSVRCVWKYTTARCTFYWA